jgi:hypothetical protein
MAEEKPAVDPPAAPAHLQIKIKSQEGDHIEFKVKPSTKFEKVLAARLLNFRAPLGKARVGYPAAAGLAKQPVSR